MTAPAHARAEPAPARITPRRATGKAAAACLAAVPLLPVLVIARAADYRIPHLQDYAGVILGLGATLCLLGCLAVTPVTWLARWPSAASWRRWLGLCVFITGAAGLAVAMAGSRTGTQAGMAAGGTAREWTGTLIVALLLPLAVISNNASQRMLGRGWKTWQRRLHLGGVGGDRRAHHGPGRLGSRDGVHRRVGPADLRPGPRRPQGHRRLAERQVRRSGTVHPGRAGDRAFRLRVHRPGLDGGDVLCPGLPAARARIEGTRARTGASSRDCGSGGQTGSSARR